MVTSERIKRSFALRAIIPAILSIALACPVPMADARRHPAAAAANTGRAYCLSPALSASASLELNELDMGSIMDNIFLQIQEAERTKTEYWGNQPPYIVFLDIDDTLLRVHTYAGSEHFCGRTFSAMSHFSLPFSEWYHSHARIEANGLDTTAGMEQNIDFKTTPSTAALARMQDRCKAAGLNVKFVGLTARASMEQPLVKKSLSRAGIQLNEILFVNSPTKTSRIQQHLDSFGGRDVPAAFLVDDSARGLSKVNAHNEAKGFEYLKSGKVRTYWYGLYHKVDQLKYLEQLFDNNLSLPRSRQAEITSIYMRAALGQIGAYARDKALSKKLADAADTAAMAKILNQHLSSKAIDTKDLLHVFEQIYSSLYFLVTQDIGQPEFEHNVSLLQPIIEAIFRNGQIARKLKKEFVDELTIFCMYRHVAIEDPAKKHFVRQKVEYLFKMFYSLNRKFTPYSTKLFDETMPDEEYVGIRQQAAQDNKILLQPPVDANQGVYRHELAYAKLLGYEIENRYKFWDDITPPTYSFSTSQAVENQLLDEITLMRIWLPWAPILSSGYSLDELKAVYNVSKLGEKLTQRDELLRGLAHENWTAGILGEFTLDEIIQTSSYYDEDPRQKRKLEIKRHLLRRARRHSSIYPGITYSIDAIIEADKADAKIAMLNEYRAKIIKNAVFMPKKAQSILYGNLFSSLFISGRATNVNDMEKTKDAKDNFLAKFRESLEMDAEKRRSPSPLQPKDRINGIFPEGFFRNDTTAPAFDAFGGYASEIVAKTEIKLTDKVSRNKPPNRVTYRTSSSNALIIEMPGVRISYHPTRKDIAPLIEMERAFWDKYIGSKTASDNIYVIESIVGRLVLAAYLYESIPDMLDFESVELFTETIMAHLYKGLFEDILSDYLPPAVSGKRENKAREFEPDEFLEQLRGLNKILDRKKDHFNSDYINSRLDALYANIEQMTTDILESPTTPENFYIQKDISRVMANKTRDIIAMVRQRHDIPSYRALRYHLKMMEYQMQNAVASMSDIAVFRKYLNEIFNGKVKVTQIKREEVDDITKQYAMTLTVEDGSGISTDEIIHKINLIYRDKKLEFKHERSYAQGDKRHHVFERAGTHGHLCNKLRIVTSDKAGAQVQKSETQAFSLEDFLPADRLQNTKTRIHSLLQKQDVKEDDIVEFLAYTYLTFLANSMNDPDRDDDQITLLLKMRGYLDEETERLYKQGQNITLLNEAVIRLKNLGISKSVYYKQDNEADIRTIRQRLHDELINRDSFISRTLEKAFSQFNLSDVHSHISGSIEPELLLAMFWADSEARRDFVETMVINNEDSFRGKSGKTAFDENYLQRNINIVETNPEITQSTLFFPNPQDNSKNITVNQTSLHKLIKELEGRRHEDFSYSPRTRLETVGDIFFYLASSGTSLLQDSQVSEIADNIFALRETFDWEKGRSLQPTRRRDRILALAELSRNPGKRIRQLFDAHCGNFSSYVRFKQKDNKGDIVAYLYILETGSIPLRGPHQPEFITTAMADKIYRDYLHGLRTLEIRSSGARVGARYSMEDTITALMEGHELGQELIRRKIPDAEDMDTSQIICFRKEIKSIIGQNAYAKYKGTEKIESPGRNGITESYCRQWQAFFEDIIDFVPSTGEKAPESRFRLQKILTSNSKFRSLVFTLKNDNILLGLANILSERDFVHWDMEREIKNTIALLRRLPSIKNPEAVNHAVSRHLNGNGNSPEDLEHYLKGLKELVKGAEAEAAVNEQMDTLIGFKTNLTDAITLVDLLYRTTLSGRKQKLNTKHTRLLERMGIFIYEPLAPDELRRKVLTFINDNRQEENIAGVLHLLEMAGIHLAPNTDNCHYYNSRLKKLRKWDDRLIAVDTVGAEYQADELDNPYHTWIHRLALARAKAHGFMVTEHAGESWRPTTGDTVENALNRIMVAISRGAQRIGHATIARIDPRKLFDSRIKGSGLESNMLTNRMISKNVIIESCPTSNFLLQDRIRLFFDHPLLKMLAVKLKVVPATDNSGILNTSQPREFALTTFVSNLKTSYVKQLLQNMKTSTFRHLKKEQEEHRQRLFTPDKPEIIFVTGEPISGKTTTAMELAKWQRNPMVISSSELLQFLAYIWRLSGYDLMKDPKKRITDVLSELEIVYRNDEVLYFHPMLGSERALKHSDFHTSDDKDITQTPEFKALAERPDDADESCPPVMVADWIAAQAGAIVNRNVENMERPVSLIIEGGRRTTNEIREKISIKHPFRTATFFLSNGQVLDTTPDLIALRLKWENPGASMDTIVRHVSERFQTLRNQDSKPYPVPNSIRIDTSKNTIEDTVGEILRTIRPPTTFNVPTLNDALERAA